MYSKRQNKVARLLQKELGEIFQKQGRNFFQGALITVTIVRISPDLSVARVYLSLFAQKNNDELFDLIKESNKTIRHQLAQRVRHQLRAVPELIFYKDDSLDMIEKIDDLLK